MVSLSISSGRRPAPAAGPGRLTAAAPWAPRSPRRRRQERPRAEPEANPAGGGAAVTPEGKPAAALGGGRRGGAGRAADGAQGAQRRAFPKGGPGSRLRRNASRAWKLNTWVKSNVVQRTAKVDTGREKQTQPLCYLPRFVFQPNWRAPRSHWYTFSPNCLQGFYAVLHSPAQSFAAATGKVSKNPPLPPRRPSLGGHAESRAAPALRCAQCVLMQRIGSARSEHDERSAPPRSSSGDPTGLRGTGKLPHTASTAMKNPLQYPILYLPLAYHHLQWMFT